MSSIVLVRLKELNGSNTVATEVDYSRFCTGDTICPQYNTLKVYAPPRRFTGILDGPWKERNNPNPSFWKQFEIENTSSSTLSIYLAPRDTLESNYSIFFAYKDGYFYPKSSYSPAIGLENYYGSIVTESHPYFTGGTFTNWNNLIGTFISAGNFPPNSVCLQGSFEMLIILWKQLLLILLFLIDQERLFLCIS